MMLFLLLLLIITMLMMTTMKMRFCDCLTDGSLLFRQTYMQFCFCDNVFDDEHLKPRVVNALYVYNKQWSTKAMTSVIDNDL